MLQSSFVSSCRIQWIPRRGQPPKAVLALAVAWLTLAPPATARAERDANDAAWVSIGGQIGIRAFQSHLKLAAGYERWLGGSAWLEGGLGVLVLARPDFTLDGGLRWKLVRWPSGGLAFVRSDLTLALLFSRSETRVAIGPKAGGGLGYQDGDFAVTLEGLLTLAPMFGGGGGVGLAAALDILVGVEFLF